MDGMIKFWNYRTVDQADPPEKDRFLEIEPSFTIAVQDSMNYAKIMGACKTNGDSNSHDYFIQVSFPNSLTFYNEKLFVHKTILTDKSYVFSVQPPKKSYTNYIRIFCTV